MRRLLGVLAAVAVALTGAPAGAAPDGEVVITANGPSFGSITVPSTITLDLPRATVDTSEHVVLAVLRPGGQVTALGYRAPGFEEQAFARHGTHEIQRGRSDVRVLTRGRTTITIPAPGLGRRLTVRLTRAMGGTVTQFGPLGGTVGRFSSELVFGTARRRMLVLHGALLRYSAVVTYNTTMCVVPSDAACAEDVLPPSPGINPMRLQVVQTLPGRPSARATYSTTAIGPPDGPGRHYVLALPLE